MSDSAPDPLIEACFPFQRHEKIGDIDIIVTTYIDKHFVVITQLKKFGTLVRNIFQKL